MHGIHVYKLPIVKISIGPFVYFFGFELYEKGFEGFEKNLSPNINIRHNVPIYLL